MSKKTIQMALLIAMASVLFSLESLIPMPFPWMRIGLANVMTLLALKWWGLREALIIVVLRVFVGSLLVGKFFHPLFVMSMSGGIISTLVMSFSLSHFGNIFSLLGVSLLGAFSKNVVQLVVATWFYIRHIQIVWMLPPFLLTSLVSGIVVGFLALILVDRLNKGAGFQLK